MEGTHSSIDGDEEMTTMTRSPARAPRLRRLAQATTASAAVAILAVISGCSRQSVDLGTADSDDVIVASISGEPDQLDPHSTTSYFAFEVLENVYDTLVEPDEEFNMQPALAESWEVSDDELTWTFHLREGVTFHDGSDFTADDVVYSYRRIIDGELANAWKLTMLTDVRAVDDHTVEIDVDAPSPTLLSALGGFKGVAIVEEGNAESGDITTEPVGTGPFAVDSARPGDSVTLKANEDYWGGAPEVAGVQFRYITEHNTAVAALRSGEIDWTDSIPPQQFGTLDKDQSLHIESVISNDYWYVAMNEAKEPFDDPQVRQAIAYAVDRDSIAQATGFGTSEVNQTAIPGSSPWAYDYAPFERDTDKAQQLLDEAGVSDLSMELMVTNEYPETVTAAQVIADNLSDVGISVSITTLDFGSWLDRQGQGDFDALMLGWLGNIDPDDYYYAQHHSEGPSNSQGYSNPEVDKLLDAGRVEMDEGKRHELYEQAAKHIVDDVSYLYLYNPAVIQAHTSRLEGYTIRSDRAVRFRDAKLTED